MNRRTFFKMTAGLTALFSGVKAFATGTPTLTPLDKIGVRRLIVEIRRMISHTGNSYMFGVNNQESRELFCKRVNEYLEGIKQRKGMDDYQLVCDETTNPPNVIAQGRLDGMLFIKPRKSVEIVMVDFSIVPPK